MTFKTINKIFWYTGAACTAVAGIVATQIVWSDNPLLACIVAAAFFNNVLDLIGKPKETT